MRNHPFLENGGGGFGFRPGGSHALVHEFPPLARRYAVGLGDRESTWLFPAIEVVHVFAISLVFGTIAIIDLRLLGLASANRRYTEMAHELLPLCWGAWFVAAVFGTLLIASRPVAYFENADFRLKFLCMGLPG